MNTVAVTPTSKGHRVWIQALESKGITAPRFTQEFTESHIILTFGDDGKRKVTQSKGGIVDIVGQKVTTWAKGSIEARVIVEPETQRILITRL